MKRIVIRHGLRKQIMTDLGVTYLTIRAALSFKSDTRMAKVIRLYALEHGGVTVTAIDPSKELLS